MMKVPDEHTHVIDTDTWMQHAMRIRTGFFIGNLLHLHGNAQLNLYATSLYMACWYVWQHSGGP